MRNVWFKMVEAIKLFLGIKSPNAKVYRNIPHENLPLPDFIEFEDSKAA